MNSERYLNLFLDVLKIESGLSSCSISAYRSDILQLENFLHKKKPKKGLLQATKDDLLAYIKFLNSRGLSSKSQSRKISSMKRFYSFCFAETYINNDPTITLKNPQIEKSLPKFLQENDIEKLLLHASNDKDKMFYVMLELLYSTGLRISELISIKVSDLKENNSFLIVKGKGNKERMIPLLDFVKDMLQKWIEEKNKIIPNSLFLFPSKHSKQGFITRERFAQKLKQLASNCSIDTNLVSPHVFRHSFASHILNNGGDLIAIQKLLGHSSISTTEIYTHIQDSKLKQDVFNNHPLARKPK